MNCVLLGVLFFAAASTSGAQLYGNYDYGESTPRYGSAYDWQSGNCYSWHRSYDGSTRIQGFNSSSGSVWSHGIRPNGSQYGMDSRGNSWNYDSRTGNYFNYGTGRMCTGKGYARTCF